MSAGATPAWRWLAAGLLFAGLAAYMLFTGEMALDKKRTVYLARAAQPVAYWLIVLVCALLGGLALRKAWLQLRS
jgi:hypothetical protein